MQRISARLFAITSLIVGTLLPLGASAQWSGTNGQIFFAYSNAGVTSIAAANPDMSQSHIVIQGSSTKFEQDFAISKAGDKIVYVEGYSGADPVLRIAKSDGTVPATIYTPTVAASSLSKPTFSPDGLTVFFIVDTHVFGPANGIYSVVVATGVATQLTSDVVVTPAVSTIGGGLVLSDTNSKLYFVKTKSSSPQTSEIDSINFNGSGVATVYSSPTAFISLSDILPNGTTLTFVYDMRAPDAQLHSVDTATGLIVKQVTNVTAPDGIQYTSGSYSPDQVSLIYTVQDYSVMAKFVGAAIVKADGSGTPTAFRADARMPNWSTTPLAAAGTYPTPLVLGDTTLQGGAGANVSSTSPGLPKAGTLPSRSLPLALLSLGLLTVGAIEVVGRVRRTNR